MESHVAPTESKQDYSADLIEMVQQFESAEQTTSTARGLAQRDRDYYDEKQRTAEEEAEMQRRGQPTPIMNEVKPKVNTMMGLEKAQRKDPKAFPRNPDDEDAAQAATDSIRYVCDASRWDDKRSLAAKELAIEGTCAIMVGVKEIKQRKSGLMASTAMTQGAIIDPDIRRIAWDRFYYDPASSEFDFADAGYMGIVIWMDLADAVRKYPEAKDILEGTCAAAKDSDTYDDKPKHGMWADYKRKRVRLCEHYYVKDGVWMFCIFTQGGFVIEPRESPYLDDEGEPENPICAVSLYVDRDNNRYGEVRSMIGAQDTINKSESKFVSLISQRQVRVSPSVAIDPAKVRKELSRADGVFIGEQGDVEILPTNDMAAANFQLNQEAKSFIHRTGPNAALAGKSENDMSGRAIIAQQQGGMVESATFLDCIRVLSLAVYSKAWNRIRQYWPGERWIRVTDSNRNIRFVGLNQPVTALQAMAKQLGVSKDQLPQLQQAAQQGDPQAAQILQQLQAFAMDPRSQQVVAIENNVAELDVDIIIDEGMDTPTTAAEQFDTLAKVMPSLVNLPPAYAKMLIQASSLRNKDEVLKALDEMSQQGPSPAQQQMEQIAMAGEVAKVEKTQSETAENIAQTEKIRTETMTGAFTAGVNSVPQQPGVAA